MLCVWHETACNSIVQHGTAQHTRVVITSTANALLQQCLSIAALLAHKLSQRALMSDQTSQQQQQRCLGVCCYVCSSVYPAFSYLPAASLLSMLSNKGASPIPSRRISSSGCRHQSSAQQQQLQAQRAAAAASAAAAVKRLSGRDLEHLQQLHTFFSGLGDDMAAAVQRLALQGFNQWLVSSALACTQGQFDDGVVSAHCSSAVWLLCMALPLKRSVERTLLFVLTSLPIFGLQVRAGVDVRVCT
jgi:hypothetical protein